VPALSHALQPVLQGRQSQHERNNHGIWVGTGGGLNCRAHADGLHSIRVRAPPYVSSSNAEISLLVPIILFTYDYCHLCTHSRVQTWPSRCSTRSSYQRQHPCTDALVCGGPARRNGRARTAPRRAGIGAAAMGTPSDAPRSARAPARVALRGASVNPVNSGGAGFGWTPGGPGSRFGPQGASHSSSHRPSVLIRDVRDHIVCIMNMSTESTSQSTSHRSNWWAHERPHQRVSGRACGPPRQRARNRARRRTCGRVCEQVHAERVDKRAAKRVTQARAGHVDRRVPSASTGVRPSEWTEVRPSTWTSALTSARLSA
jgi:hypothetical protein